MNKTEKSTVQLIIDGQQSKVSLKEMGIAVKTLKKELREMREADDPKAWAEKARQVQIASKAYVDATERVKNLSAEGKKFKASWKDVFTGFLGGTAVTYVLQTLGNLATIAKDKLYTMSDSLADVGKATDLGKKQVRELNSELAKIDTRTATQELRDMSIVAGKNGIQKDLAGFVKSTDMINIALGDEFGNVTELTETIVDLRKIFRDIQSDSIEQDVLHIGNAINYLADKGTASGKVMTEFAGRMGGTLIPLGTTTGQILGLATTMEELSITAERGSTAVNTIFQNMLTDVESFAKVAGVSTEQFRKMLNTDIWSAFNLFMVGAKKGGAEATQFAKILADVELSGSGASEVILKLSSNQQMLSGYVKDATEQLKQTGSITEEVSKKNNNAAAIIDKFGKIAVSVFEGIALRAMDVVEAVGPMILSMGSLSSKFQEHRTLIQAVATAILVYYANIIKATLATTANTTAQIANRIAVAASVPIYSLAGTGLRLMTIWHQMLNGQITIGTAVTRVFAMAQRSLYAIWAANPLGVVIAGLSAAIGLLKLYSDNTKEAIALERAKHKLSVDLGKVTRDNEKAQAMLNERIGDYNSLSNTEQENLKNEVALRRQKLTAQLKNIEAQKVELSQQAAAPSIWQKFIALAKGTALGGGTNYGQQMASAAADNMQEVNEQFNSEIENLKKSLESYDSMSRQIERVEKSKAEQAAALKKAGSGSGTGDNGDGKKTKKSGKSMFTLRHEYGVAEEEYDTKRAEQKASYAQAEKEYDQQRIDQFKEYLDAEKEYDQMMAERQAKENFDRTNNELSMGEATGQITPDAANRAKLDAEDAYLAELYLIRKSYGQDTADLEQGMAQASIERARQVTETERANAEQQREIALTLQTAKMDALEQGASALKNYFKETSLIYKALFLVEKAAAIANVIIKAQAEIAATSAYAATLGPVAGPIYEAAMIAKTKIRTGISIATIAAQSVQSFIPGREQGGYTDLNSLQKSKNPAGYVSKPTLFNLGQRSFIAGENYKTEYVIPSTMLQDPYFAGQAKQMEMYRTTGRHPLSGSGSENSDGGSADNAVILMMLLDEFRKIRTDMRSGAIGVNFNTTRFDEHQNLVNYIRETTSL